MTAREQHIDCARRGEVMVASSSIDWADRARPRRRRRTLSASRRRPQVPARGDRHHHRRRASWPSICSPTSLAEFEADLVWERTRAGRAAAPGARQYDGSDPEQLENARTLLANPNLSARQVTTVEFARRGAGYPCRQDTIHLSLAADLRRSAARGAPGGRSVLFRELQRACVGTSIRSTSDDSVHARTMPSMRSTSTVSGPCGALVPSSASAPSGRPDWPLQVEDR